LHPAGKAGRQRIEAVGFRVHGFTSRVEGLVFSVQGKGFRVWVLGLGFRV